MTVVSQNPLPVVSSPQVDNTFHTVCTRDPGQPIHQTLSLDHFQEFKSI
ncbi:MAG: hypothetical protein JO235_19390 [Chroococcidiopsidaceae cyanobacterium CP_BM_RX_35]|nr:hypothetical protein [Chroococcidiopsidaceae cyanobacterium CP_BM_RX_35]